MLQPIQTEWRGYKFRSRLEARWAVFFAALGIPFEYEPEGFDIDGQRYLPDFYLPNQLTWVEIKPRRQEKSYEKEFKLLRSICNKSFGLFIAGSPGISKEDYFVTVACESLQHNPYIVPFGWFRRHPPPAHKWLFVDVEEWHNADVESALLLARQARFEFGEAPIL